MSEIEAPEVREITLSRCPCGSTPKLYHAGSGVFVLGCEREKCPRSVLITCSSLAGVIGKWNRSVPLFRDIIDADAKETV